VLTVLCAVLALVVLVVVAAAVARVLLRPPDGPSLRSAPAPSRLGAAVDDAMADHPVPGVQVAVVGGGRTTWTRAWGAGTDDDSVFQIGSLSKPVASATIAHLADRGVLDLDTPVGDLLTSWSLPAGTPHPDDVTLRRLLSHTAGIDVSGYLGHDPAAPLPTTAEALDDDTTTADGDRVAQDGDVGSFRYSGGGYTIAQQVVEDVTGRPFADVVAEQVLGPLGMTHSGYACTTTASAAPDEATGHDLEGRPSPRWRYAEQAAAGLCSTASDLARFAAWLGSDDPVAAALRRPVAASYGLGVHVDDVDGETVVGHDGNNRGFMSDLRVDPATGVGLVVVTDGDAGGAVIDAVRAATR